MRLKLLGVVVLSVSALTAPQKNPLTNADVIKMVKAGLAETTISAAIAANDTQFDLSSSGLQALNQAGVSSKVIRAMLAAESKKKDAAAAAENSTPAQDATTPQSSTPDASSGMSPQGMMPPGMSSDSMAQMMANMPPEMRLACKPSMAKRNTAGRVEESGWAVRQLEPFHLMPVCRFHWIARSIPLSHGWRPIPPIAWS